MTRRKLLLCFDAFDTLFSPKVPIARQYARVAHDCGLTNLNREHVRTRFRLAFNGQRKQHPNYGKAQGLDATQWWTNVIKGTFTPFLRPDQMLPSQIVPKLLDRFASKKAYRMEPELVPSLQSLRTVTNSRHFSRIVTGVITNSDDRVPDVLSSFGLRVSPLRFGKDAEPVWGEKYDIDFHCISYDVGFEKPDGRIFKAAESMLDRILEGERAQGLSSDQQDAGSGDWLKVYVGDQWVEDIQGSQDAGWKAVYLNPDRPEDNYDSSLADIMEQQSVITVQNVSNLVKWLASEK